MLFHDIEKNRKNIAIYLNKNNLFFYEDLIKESDKFLKNFKGKKLIILIAENNLETLIAYVALMRSDNLLMILDPNTRVEDINLIIKKYSPAYILCSKKKGKNIFDNNFKIIFSYLNFDLIEYKIAEKYQIFDDLKILLSTSGSLGEAKFVKLSNNNLKKNTQSIISYLNMNESDRSITTMPMSYSYGLSIINTHLLCGGSIVLNNNSLIDKKFWELFYESTPSNINGVPFFYDLLIKVGFNRILNPKLKFITQAGGKINKNTFQKICLETLKNNLNFFLMYGQTEAGPRISYHKVKKKDLELKELPIGKAIPGGEIYIKNKNDVVVNQNYVEGEIYYKGDNIFGGYSKNFSDLNEFNFFKELKTGDLGYRSDDGNFFVSGRRGRFIKVFGYRFSLDFIEEKINNIEKNSVACIGFKDFLYIFSKKKIIDLEKIITLPKDSYKVIIINEFPLNSNGKISYNELAKQIGD